MDDTPNQNATTPSQSYYSDNNLGCEANYSVTWFHNFHGAGKLKVNDGCTKMTDVGDYMKLVCSGTTEVE
jgi:hypothetical protein